VLFLWDYILIPVALKLGLLSTKEKAPSYPLTLQIEKFDEKQQHPVPNSALFRIQICNNPDPKVKDAIIKRMIFEPLRPIRYFYYNNKTTPDDFGNFVVESMEQMLEVNNIYKKGSEIIEKMRQIPENSMGQLTTFEGDPLIFERRENESESKEDVIPPPQRGPISAADDVDDLKEMFRGLFSFKRIAALAVHN